MADWYVSQAGAGTKSGASYANRWDTMLNVVWGSGGVEPGDTLWICGCNIHTMTSSGGIATQADIGMVTGEPIAPITIRGDYPGDSGVLWSSYNPQYESWIQQGSPNDDVWAITLKGDTDNTMLFEDIGNPNWDSFTRLNKVTGVDEAAGIVACQAAAGSYYSIDYENASTFYVHCTDDGDPTDRVYLNRYGYEFILGNGFQHITFLNLMLRCYYRFEFSDGAGIHDISWLNCDIGYIEGRMITARGASNSYLAVDDSELQYGQTGVYLIAESGAGPHHCAIRRNKFHHMGYVTEQQGQTDPHGIGWQSGHHNVFEDNEFWEVEDGIVGYIYAGNDCYDNVLRRNYVHDLHGLGGHYKGMGMAFGSPAAGALGNTSGNRIYANILCDGENGIYYKWGDQVEIYHNVCYNNDINFKFAGSDSDAVGTDIVFKNNLSLSPINYHIYYDARDGTVGDGELLVDSNHNHFYPLAGDQFFYRDGDGVPGSITLTEWKAVTRAGCTFDPSSLSSDPQLENRSGGYSEAEDFKPRSSSPCLNAGATVGVDRDFKRIPIPQGVAPDVGAWERPAVIMSEAVEVEIS